MAGRLSYSWLTEILSIYYLQEVPLYMNLLVLGIPILNSAISLAAAAARVGGFTAVSTLEEPKKQELSQQATKVDSSMKMCVDMIFDGKADSMKECDYSILKAGLAGIREATGGVEKVEIDVIKSLKCSMDLFGGDPMLLTRQRQEIISDILYGQNADKWYKPFNHPFCSLDSIDINPILTLKRYLAVIGFTLLESDMREKPFLETKYNLFVDILRGKLPLKSNDEVKNTMVDEQMAEILMQASKRHPQFGDLMKRLELAYTDLENALTHFSSGIWAKGTTIEYIGLFIGNAFRKFVDSHKLIFDYSDQHEKAQEIQETLKKRLSSVDESHEEYAQIKRDLGVVEFYIVVCSRFIQNGEEKRKETGDLLRIHIEQPLRRFVEDFRVSFKRLVEGEDGSLAKLLQESKGRLRSEILDESVAYDIYVIYDAINELSLVCDMIKNDIKPASDAAFLNHSTINEIFYSKGGRNLLQDIGYDYNLLRQVRIALKHDKSCDDSSKKIIRSSVAVMKIAYETMLRIMKGSYAFGNSLSSAAFEDVLMKAISRLEALEGLKSVASLDVVSKTVTTASKTILKNEPTWGGGAVSVETSEMIIGNIVHRARCCRKLFQFLIELKKATTSPVDLEVGIKV